MSRPWTEAHRRECIRRTYELAAELSESNRLGAESLASRAIWYSHEEGQWGLFISSWFDAARVNRELKRVRGLAEGRLVRETGWRITEGLYAGAWCATRPVVRRRCVRVTRIRRSPR